uniref:DUF2281 domain-containing protein n=1 Tax=Cyanothece sp. (strain PCC 7425 / ATCC 29141) TaxID=395961 RepID=B8HNT0_CYAP4
MKQCLLSLPLEKNGQYMSDSIVTQIIERLNDLPDDLQQRVLQFVTTLRQQHLHSGNAWDVLESLTGTVEAPVD